MKESTDDRLLRIDEVARLLACSKSHVRRLRSSGKLPACKIGKHSVRWKPAVVAKYLQSLRDD
jgi:excisionase family DNA binding protein